MRLVVTCIGRSSKGPERELTARYIERIPKLARAHGFSAIELVQLNESRKDTSEARKADEAAALRRSAKSGILIVLDERGTQMTSPAFADVLQQARGTASGDLHFIIGGPDGLDETLRNDAHLILALGAMTWPHQLALPLVLEQIYRALTVLSGHPYHRI